MSTQLIDFESGSLTTGDSGERTDSDATKPIAAGEGVKSAVFDRPLENLRARTEELRKKVEELLYRADADKWIITGGDAMGQVTLSGAVPFPEVTWSASAGAFLITEDIVVQPFMAPNTDLFASQDYVFGGAATFTFSLTAHTATPAIGPLRQDYQLANSARIIWEEALPGAISGGYCEAALEGSPEHILRITIRNDGLTQASNVVTALNLILAPTVTTSPFSYVLAGIGSTYVLLSDITGSTDVTLTSSYSRELHLIARTDVPTFFGSNPLADDGDGVGIWFEELVDSVATGRGGRRQATPLTYDDVLHSQPNTTVPVSKLFLFSATPEQIPGAIPLCRRIGTSLVFIDGTVVADGETATFGGEGSIDTLRAEYDAHVAGTADKHTAAVVTTALIAGSPESAGASDVQAQLAALYGHVNDRVEAADLAEDTGASDGTTLVGVEAITGTPTSTTRGTLKNTITELLAGVNARARIASSEKITGAWQHINAGSFSEYANTVSMTAHWSASRSGGAAGPGVAIANIERGLSEQASSPNYHMWGNPRAWVNRGGLSDIAIDKQIVLNVRNTAAQTVSGMISRVIISGGRSDAVIRISNIYSLLGASNAIDLSAYLPSGSGEVWQILSLCSVGDGVFGVMFRDVTPASDEYRVHCFQMTYGSPAYTVAPYSSFPATGVALPGVGAFGAAPPLPANACNMVSDGTYLFTANGWNAGDTTDVISRITCSSGAISSGRGDCPNDANEFTTGGLCSLGNNVYFTLFNISSGVPTMSSIQKTSLAAGAGTAGLPMALGTTIGDYCEDICTDGVALYCPIYVGDVIPYCTASQKVGKIEGSGFIIGSSAFAHCCFDGRNLWLTEYVAGKGTNLIAIDVARVRGTDVTTTMLAGGARRYFPFRFGEFAAANPQVGRLLFDGGSIITPIDSESGETYSGTFVRLSCSTDRG